MCDRMLMPRESSSIIDFQQYVKSNKDSNITYMFGRNMSKKFTKRVFGGTTYYLGLRLKKDNKYILTKEERDAI